MRKNNKMKKALSVGLASAMCVTAVFGTGLPAVEAAEEETMVRQLIPKPLEYEVEAGKFVLEDNATIAVAGETVEETAELERIGHYIEETFEASTGYNLTVEEGTDGDINLTTVGGDEALGGQGYEVESTSDAINVKADETEGIWNGLQSVRQLFPGEIESNEEVTGVEWAAPVCTIKDKPEYEYRGFMLDSVRHFLSVDQVKRQIDLAAQYKVNKLHLRLADDQGWRLEIKGEMYGESFDKLRTIGASTSCTSNGVSAGQYTQEEFKELVKYANDHYVEIIPEFDMPGHSWAAMVSLEFLNSTPDGKPHSGNYNNTKPYEGWDVGFSTMECRNEKTYEFLDEVIKQVAAISPSQYIHIGGDEAHSTSTADYNYFMNRVADIVQKYGKTPYGWQNFDSALLDDKNKGGDNYEDAMVQFWSLESRGAKYKPGIKYVASTADHAYLDMKYDSGCPYGLQWATFNPVDDAYNWDPTNQIAAGGSKDQIVGVEAELFGETIRTNEALDYMIYPRLPGHAEVGWTPKDARSWDEYKTRIAAHDKRFEAQGVQYRRDELIWEKPYVPTNIILPMDEGTGTTTKDVAGKYTATFSPSGVTWVDGKFGKAVRMDGTGFIDVKADDIKNDWTIGMWVKPEATVGTNAVLISGNEGEIKLDQWKNTGKVGITKFGATDATFDYSAPVGEWVHLAFKGNKTGTTLYVNGEKMGTSSVSISGPAYRIGANKKEGLESTGNMAGTLDSVQIVDKALSDDEIKAMMGDPTDFSEIEWKMDEGEGTTIKDTTGRLTAELGNGVTFAEGKYGNGLHFNGTGYVDLGLENIEDDWTIGMWINREKQAADNATLMSGTDGNNLKLDQWKNTGKVGFSKSGVDDWMFDYSAPLGKWVHLTFKKDSTGITLYVNGKETAHNNSSIDGPLARLGANLGDDLDNLGYMQATVDELHVFERALEADEIAQLAVDKAELKADIDRINDAFMKLNQEDYVGSTWIALQNALEQANVTYNKADATQKEIDDARTALNAAFEGLELKTADYTRVDEAKAKAEALKAEDFTEESWAALQAAIEAVTEGLDITKQEEVDAMAQAIEDAIAALEEKEDTTGKFLVTVIDGVITSTGESTGYFEFGKGVTVRAAAEKDGVPFEGWRVNDKIVSENLEYMFYVTNNMTVEAVYGDAVSLEAIMTNQFATKREDGKYDVKFVAQLIIPEGYKLEEAGLVWSSKETPLVVNGKLNPNLKPTYITRISTTNQFSVTIKGMPAGRYLRGKIFAKVIDPRGNERWIYSEEGRVETEAE